MLTVGLDIDEQRIKQRLRKAITIICMHLVNLLEELPPSHDLVVKFIPGCCCCQL